MKITEHKKPKKEKRNAKPIPKAKVLIVAQELKFARLLAGNEKKSRDRVLKSLKKWLRNCFEKNYEFKEEDFVRVWKGLFYAVWMSDKPLVQEELCESISEILDEFPSKQYRHALMMFKAGLRVLATEWYGLDQHRIDKFLMLVRRLLRASFRCIARQDWSTKACELHANALTDDSILSVKTPSFARNALSLMLHICECFLEELSKVSKGSIPSASVATLLSPFVQYTCSGQELSGCVAARRTLTQLLRQSEAGVQHEERRRAWERMGCPEGGPEALELASDDDDDDDDSNNDDEFDDNGALDPRAGRGDVVLRSLPVPAARLAGALRLQLRHAGGAAHRRIKVCLKRFDQFASNHYPFRVAVPSVLPTSKELKPVKPRKAAITLDKLDRKLRHDPGKTAMRGLSRKHRKRLLARARDGVSIADDLNALRNTNIQTNGKWQIEEAVPAKDTSKDCANKENCNKDCKKTKKRKPSTEKQDNSPPKKQKVEERSRKEKVEVNGKEKMHKDDKSKSKKVEAAKNPQKNHVETTDKYKSKESTDKCKVKETTDKCKEKETTDKYKVKESTDKCKKKSTTDKHKEKIKETTHKCKDKETADKYKAKESTDKGKPDKEKIKKTLNGEKRKKESTKTTVVANKVKHFQKQTSPAKIEKKSDKKPKKIEEKTPTKANSSFNTPKKIKFVLKNNSMQSTMDYYKSVKQSPNIPFDGKKKPTKTNLKPNSTPSPINPFFKKKLRMKN